MNSIVLDLSRTIADEVSKQCHIDHDTYLSIKTMAFYVLLKNIQEVGVHQSTNLNALSHLTKESLETLQEYELRRAASDFGKVVLDNHWYSMEKRQANGEVETIYKMYVIGTKAEE